MIAGSVSVTVRVLIVSWLRQGIVIGHAHLVPGFAYIGPLPPEIYMLAKRINFDAREYGQCYH